MVGWVEGIRRALVLGLVRIAGTAIEQAPSVASLPLKYHHHHLRVIKFVVSISPRISLLYR